jgi:hypothetical protein
VHRNRIVTPGKHGDTFAERLRCGSCTPGEIGQFIDLDHPFNYIAAIADLANENGLGGKYDVPDFLWIPPNGNNPIKGPTLTLRGSPWQGATPYQLKGGSAVVSEVHTGNSNRATSESFDPGLTDDIVLLLIGTYGPDSPGYYSWFMATRGSDRGWRLGIRHDTNQMYVFLNGDSLTSASAPSGSGVVNGYFIVIAVVDRSHDVVVAYNNNFGSLGSIPSGSLASGVGLGLCALPSGAGDVVEDSSVLGAAIWYGTGIADFWKADSYAPVKELTQYLSGISPVSGIQGIYTRASAATWKDRNGRWAIASPGLPRCGDSSGLVLSPARTNEAYRNINPLAGHAAAALTWTGAKAPTEVDDSTALAVDDAEVWGPNVYEYANDTGATQYIRMSAQTGNTNARSLQCLIRQVAGSGTVKLGLYDESAGTFSGTTIHDGYDERTIINGQIPGDNDLTLCLEVPDGVTIRWIAHDMGEGAYAQYPTPNWATATSASRSADLLATSHTNNSDQQSVEATVTPLGWSAWIINTSVGGTIILYAATLGGGRWAVYDSTLSEFVPPPTVPTDGVSHKVRSRWKGAVKSIVSAGDRDSGSYDGSMGAGVVSLTPTYLESKIKDLVIYRNGDG